MNRRKNTWIAVILLFLIFLLAALILLRMIRQHTEIVSAAETEIETGTTPSVEPAAPEPEEVVVASDTETQEQAEDFPVKEPRSLREVALSERDLDPALFEEAEEQGTVRIVDYITRDYYCDEYYDIRKQMAVYLPYGYNEEQQYDVLVLLHCGWADYRFWLVNERDYCTPEGEKKPGLSPGGPFVHYI